MDLILVAVVALVVLAGLDADLWPRALPMARRRTHVVRPPWRAPTRAARRERAATRPAPAYSRPSSHLCPTPRWWWE
jgi:hypothetical protein